MSHDERRALAARLLGPGRPEIGCDACFERLDEYVDAELCGNDADVAVPGMSAHLDGCPACREDYLSLRDLAAGTP
jgi:predicted anti-sigma-YlaC factor YlaD